MNAELEITSDPTAPAPMVRESPTDLDVDAAAKTEAMIFENTSLTDFLIKVNRQLNAPVQVKGSNGRVIKLTPFELTDGSSSSGLRWENTLFQLLKYISSDSSLKELTAKDLREVLRNSSEPLENTGQVALAELLDGRFKLSQDEIMAINTALNGMRQVTPIVAEYRKLADLNKERAGRDTLTSLPNRLALMEWLSDRSESYGQSGDGPETEPVRTGQLVMMQIDIDWFKQVNDCFSHAVGDNVLAELANLIRQTFRTHEDALIRYGGEEFWIIIEVKQGQNTKQRIAERFAQLNEKFKEASKKMLSSQKANEAALPPGQQLVYAKTLSAGVQEGSWNDGLMKVLVWLSKQADVIGQTRPDEMKLVTIENIIASVIEPNLNLEKGREVGKDVTIITLRKLLSVLRELLEAIFKHTELVKSGQPVSHEQQLAHVQNVRDLDLSYEQLVSDVFVKCFNIYTNPGELALSAAKGARGTGVPTYSETPAPSSEAIDQLAQTLS